MWEPDPRPRGKGSIVGPTRSSDAATPSCVGFTQCDVAGTWGCVEPTRSRSKSVPFGLVASEKDGAVDQGWEADRVATWREVRRRGNDPGFTEPARLRENGAICLAHPAVEGHEDGVNRILLRLGLSAGLGLVSSAPAAIDFKREIEPILVKRCSECHGADKQKSGLRLDSRTAALHPAKSGHPAILPGKPAESPLLVRVQSKDSDEMMPPKGERLTADEVSALHRWIEEGALWPELDPRQHWAFVRPSAPALPAVSGAHAAWVKNEIDRFVLARLEKEGLAPQAEADRYTLARRVSLDLTGLPPSWEDVQRFVQDASTDAYEKFVDRLLASPHYGEHMARAWLDLARYADSNGYQVDLARSVWPYRDWVIRAFNQNKPFDQFTVEQLAGDLLPGATLDQRIATGFNRNTKINDEGGGDAEEYRVKAVKDRVATVGTTWLGLTFMCAECHTHKYDPITHDDYYRFYAFFNNSTDGGNYSTAPTADAPAPDVSRPLQYVQGRLAQLRRELASAEQALPAEMAAWEKSMRAKGSSAPRGWQVLALTNLISTGGSGYTNLPDGSVLATGVNPIYDTITAEAETGLAGITAVLLEVLPDASLPKKGPGRWSQNGNFILDEFSMTVPPGKGGETNIVFRKATADWEQDYYRAEHAIDRNPRTGWAIAPRSGDRHFLIAELQEPLARSGRGRVAFRFDHYHGSSHCLGRFRISVTTERDPARLWPVAEEAREALQTPPALRTPEQGEWLTAHGRAASPVIRGLEREILRLEQRERALASPSRSTLVMQERSEPEPRKTHVQVRGNFLEKGREVIPGVPAMLPALPPEAPLNRLSLARWLVDLANPLPARVAVNHYWERCFGTGLVKTSDDFGRQGEPPSHPELLDWLALEFVKSGWDVKGMQKLLVLSAAYRQTAAMDAVRLEKDFYNRLLSRGPRFRLDAETIRDQALAVSGLLDDRVGGPSVYPPQVANLWKEIGFLRPEIGMDEWPASEGPDIYRRGLYTFWRRVCTYPLFATFDGPSRELCAARRPRTNTPLQALAGLNEPTLLEAARVFAQRVLREGGAGPEAQLGFAFRSCVGRSPTASERSRLRAFLEQQLKGFQRDPASAERLIAVGPAERSAGLEAARLAAWMMLANVLLNLDETLTKG